jgi:hypothetical protein
MGQSAKRYGLEVTDNLELELRLRRIEVQLAGKSDSNQDAAELSRGAGDVPQVTGLSLGGSIPGGFTIKWTAVTISDLRKYEVQFATNLGFNENLQEFTAGSTSFPFTTADTLVSTSYFARVRAVNNVGTPGPYSITLNTSTGQAASQDIEDEAITAEKIDPADPVDYSGLNDSDVGAKLALRGHIDGLILSNNSTDSDHDIDVAVGSCRDSTNVVSLFNTATLTKQIDASWTEGSDAGGLASSLTLSADTTYHVFLLRKTVSDTTVDVGFDTSTSATNLLADATEYSFFRRIGSVTTDSSANIRGFTQDGDEFIYDVYILDFNDANPGSGSAFHVTRALTVPTGIQVRALVVFQTRNSTPGANRFYAMTSFDQTETTPSVTAGFDLEVREFNEAPTVFKTVRTDISGQVRVSGDASNNDIDIRATTYGWIDIRGKDS